MGQKFLFLLLASLLFFSTPVSAFSTAERQRYAQNNILFIDDEDNFQQNCLSGELVDLGENSKTALNFLINKGYSTSSAAAIVGNLIAESSVVPNKIEGGKLINDTSWRISSWEKYGKRGFGLAQWTTKGRQDRLQSFADGNGLPIISMEAQLGYLFQELQGYSGAKVENLNAKSLEEATFYIYRFYETPRSSFCHTNDRAGCYNNYAPSSYSQLSPTETKSAYEAFSNRLKYARSALADTGNLSSASTSGTSSLTCNGVSAGGDGSAIAELAIKMSWPNADGTCDGTFGKTAWRSRAAGGTLACSATLNAVAKAAQKTVGGLSLRDCGKFVGAVIIHGGFDTEFPKVGVRAQMNYMNSSQKWVKISTDGQPYPLSELKPGDIILYSSNTGDAAGGHIQIWIGEQEVAGQACEGGKCKVNIAAASYTTWTPSLNYLTRTSSTWKGVTYYHSVYRLASTPETNIATNNISED